MIPGQSQQFFEAAAAQSGAAAYEIERSLRFNPGDSAYLDRTFLSTGDRRTFTYSYWVKESGKGTSPSSNPHVLWSGPDVNTRGGIVHRGTGSDAGELYIFNQVSGTTNCQVWTNSLHRDFSAWKHIVWAIDTTQSGATDRVKVYINGVQETLNFVTTPAQNLELQINLNQEHRISRGTPDDYGNYYLAEIQFIDGQALDPTDFGEYDDNGVWQPKEVSVSSINDGTVWSNGWDSTNINPSFPGTNSFDGSISTKTLPNNNSTATWTPSSGISIGTSLRIYGRRETAGGTLNFNFSDSTTSTITISPTTTWYEVSGAAGKTLTSVVIGKDSSGNEGVFHALEIDGEILIDSYNNSTGYGTNGFYLPFSDNSSNAALGYDAAVTQPALAPKGGMDVVTYTGNGGTQSITELGFSPDLVWIKRRNSTNNHRIFDVIRGVNLSLSSDLNGTEYTPADQLTSFNYDGFSLGSNNEVNQSSGTYVAWCWKAGGAPASNTDGTTTSQVSASTDYGFSIVSYTGNGSTGTVGHGLNATPEWIIVKNLTSTANWYVDHVALSSGKALNLNTTDAEFTPGTAGITERSSTTFSLGSSRNETNASSNNYIAYCWSEVSGFSKFGSYTGNGSTSGPTITTGFKPRFILAKRTDSTASWVIWDTARASNDTLKPNDNTAEESNYQIDVLDNGFQIKNTWGSLNASGGSYIYAAFADRPGNNWTPNNFLANQNLYPLYLQPTTGSWSSSSYTAINAFDSSLSTQAITDTRTIGEGVNFAPAQALNITSSLRYYCGSTWMGGGSNTAYVQIGSDTSTRFNVTVSNDGSWVTIPNASGKSLSASTPLIVRITGGNPQVWVTAIEVDGRVLTGGTGTGIDSLVDSPTNGDQTDTGVGNEVVGNYATFNPLAGSTIGTLSNGNLQHTYNSTNFSRKASTLGVTSGKWYAEFTFQTTGDNVSQCGVVSFVPPVNGDNQNNEDTGGCHYNGNNGNFDGTIFVANTRVSTGNPVASNGDIIGVALDADTNNVKFFRNGSVVGSSSGYTATNVSGTWYFMSSLRNNAVTVVNFGQRPFGYAAPSGYKALNTASLPDPTIADGSTAFDAKLYTGNGSTQTISGLGFSPDLVWTKKRNATQSHHLTDTVRGALKNLRSNTTGAETTDANTLTSFNSDGFTLGSESGFNGNNDTFIAWTWDAGTSTVSNTDGSVTSNVRANASAGFSIVSYTGTGSLATIGHGLNAAPELILVKSRTNAENWAVYSKAAGAANRLILNLTVSAASGNEYWNSTDPTSSVFTVNTVGQANGSGQNYVAYCFAPVDGYSSFGSYTGNGSTDGPFVFTGMRPRFILVKISSSTDNWTIIDSERIGYNDDNYWLYASSSEAEYSGSFSSSDILSNGFKPRSVGNQFNANGQTYIYAAFAEHPFKTARAR